MKRTNKQRIEQFDATLTELDKLRLACADLAGVTRFTFSHLVNVNVKDEIDPNGEGRYAVSVSMRADPLFMFREYGRGNKLVNVRFWTESEIEALSRDSQVTYWRAMNLGMYKVYARMSASQVEVHA